MTTDANEKRENDVLQVLDKVLASPDSIIQYCAKAARLASHFSSDKTREKRTAQFIISHYSNLTAAGGGISALPGLIPGIGTVLAFLGAGALDAFLALKFEIEMAMALSHLAGFDIRDPREQKLACLLACSALEDIFANKGKASIGHVLDVAVHEYSTRELSKTMAKALVRVLMMITAKRWTRLFPIIGIGIEMGVNKVLSTRLGNACWKEILYRRSSSDIVYDGEIVED